MGNNSLDEEENRFTDKGPTLLAKIKSSTDEVSSTLQIEPF